MRILMHAHHDTLFSWYPSLEERVWEIEHYKPRRERALRLRLIKDVTDLVPHNEAWEQCEKAYRHYLRCCETRRDIEKVPDPMLDAYRLGRDPYAEALKALEHHKDEGDAAAWKAAQKVTVHRWKELRRTYTALARAHARAWQAEVEAMDKLVLAIDRYTHSFDAEAFHRQHCLPDCPWDGRTIFPPQSRKG
jgi:hypothetical protein